MKVKFLLLGLLGWMGTIPMTAQAASFSEIYAFGDSLLDTGNLFEATAGPLPPGSPPPSAVPFPGPPYPGAPYFDGRFSNGPIWLEYFAPGLGLTPNPDTNFAFGGATSGMSQVQFPTIPGLLGQVSAFTSNVPISDPDALYVLSAGPNDYLFGLDPTASPAEIGDKVAETVGNITQSIVDLAGTGAVSFAVLTVPDLGITPAAAATNPGALSAISQIHNGALIDSVNALNFALGLDITVLDFNEPLYAALDNPAAFGFTNVTDACFDLATLTTCPNPDEYLFWDFVHPSAASQRALGAYALSQFDDPAHVPEPTTVIGLLALGAMGAKRCQRRRDRDNIAS